MGNTATRDGILVVLMGGAPMSCREIMAEAGLTRSQANAGLYRLWRGGGVFRTAEAIREHVSEFRGRGGKTRYLLPYHRYIMSPEGVDGVTIEGRRYVGFSVEYLDPRGGGRLSKARRILGFLEESRDGAFFSSEVVEALGEHGVRIEDVMPNVRRFERKGLVYVRGYKSDSRQTPFREGYLLTRIDQELPREEAIAEAVKRTDAALQDRASSSPIMERVHRIRDIVLEHAELRNLVSATYIENKLGCTHGEAEHALARALQLYPDTRVMKLFGAWRYYHHASMAEEDLNAAVEMKLNYIRKTRGRANRIGHNWEAVAEWFIDRFTTGARFWTQDHRKVMDPRRISLYLIKGVGGRRQAAEVDRVWEVNPGVFAPAVTYVLSCRWGVVTKRHVDDFMEVLRWSRDFGVDTEDGREIKNGVVGVFAGAAFSTKENIRMRDGEVVSLARYAARRQLQLVTATDFNAKMRERDIERLTVQAICKVARDEGQVRETLDALWKGPERAGEIMRELRAENEDLYRLEELLENGGELPAKAVEG
jgi:hypothetical protein